MDHEHTFEASTHEKLGEHSIDLVEGLNNKPLAPPSLKSQKDQ